MPFHLSKLRRPPYTGQSRDTVNLFWEMTNLEKNLGEIYKVRKAVFLLGAGVSVVVTAFSYFKVFRIIRQRQCLMQTNENAIDISRKIQKVYLHNNVYFCNFCTKLHSLSVLHVILPRHAG